MWKKTIEGIVNQSTGKSYYVPNAQLGSILHYWQRFVNYFLHVLGFKIKYSCPTMGLGPYFLFSGSSNDNFFHSKSKWGFMAIPVVEFSSREGYNVRKKFD